jgi:hypothetical protein
MTRVIDRHPGERVIVRDVDEGGRPTGRAVEVVDAGVTYPVDGTHDPRCACWPHPPHECEIHPPPVEGPSREEAHRG